MTNSTAPIVVTAGEPAGIGPDILCKLLSRPMPFSRPIVVIADPEVLKQRANGLGITLDLPDYSPNKLEPVAILAAPLKHRTRPGTPDTRNNTTVLAMLDRAIAGCLQHEFSALVTCPVNKAVINQTHQSFLGHTEYLAHQCRCDKSVMLFTYQQHRLALMTTHVPLNQVSQLITADNLRSTIHILCQNLKTHFGLPEAKILLTGLNPHAGENGCLGDEEQNVMIPTINQLIAEGYHIIGPVPADTAFHQAAKYKVEAILSLYHDQLLPVIKTLGFGQVVNVTLGLPFIRTSVDHGTAFDIAGTSAANETGLFSAISLATNLVSSKTQNAASAS